MSNVRYGSSVPDSFLAKVRGSHRTERLIQSTLGCNPQIHSGMAGRGAFCLHITQAEFLQLKAMGIRITNKKRSTA